MILVTIAVMVHLTTSFAPEPRHLTTNGHVNTNGDWDISAKHKFESPDKKASLTVKAEARGKNGKITDKSAGVKFRIEI